MAGGCFSFSGMKCDRIKKSEKLKKEKKFGMCSLAVFLWLLYLFSWAYILKIKFLFRMQFEFTISQLHWHFLLSTICVCVSLGGRFNNFIRIDLSFHGLDSIPFISFVLFRSRVYLRYKIDFTNIYWFFNWRWPKINLRMCRQTVEIH